MGKWFTDREREVIKSYEDDIIERLDKDDIDIKIIRIDIGAIESIAESVYKKSIEQKPEDKESTEFYF
ncbi:MAG: hypothetical protein QW478_09990 [Candidatus Micrarchaeaceae archaeon]